MDLPADSHTHSEFSWDYGTDPGSIGAMERICRRAGRIGLSTLVLTEHLDLEDRWYAEPGDLGPDADVLIDDTCHVRLPAFDLEGWLDQVERCRRSHPDLQILTGVEFGQPHLWWHRSLEVVSMVDRVNGSLHMLDRGDGDRTEPTTLFRDRPPEEVMADYLAEACRMADSAAGFEVFCHLDYAARSWPVEQAGPFDALRFEDGFRSALRAIARSGRALELNTRRLEPWLPTWWAEEGGRAVSFGSDSHGPGQLAHGFGPAMEMAGSCGFRPGTHPSDFWRR